MHRRTFIKHSATAGLVTLLSPQGVLSAMAGSEVLPLEERFRQPPLSDYPQVLWFWMNGHVSRQGITLDLEAMKRAGIGGVFHFDAGISIPKGPVAYGSPQWKALRNHTLQEAARLGLYYTAHNCPGWSSSGGPWITPELSMQQLTWSELATEGGRLLDLSLPLPYHKLGYYREVAVLAYPSLPGELPDFTASSGSGTITREAVTGQDPGGAVVRPAGGSPAWLQLAFSSPCLVRNLTFLISAAEPAPPEALGLRTSVVLEASDDGKAYRPVATIPTGVEAALAEGDKFITYDIAPTTARYFRLRSAQARRYRQVRFSGLERLPQFMEKTAARFMFSGSDTSPLYSQGQAYPPGSAIDPGTVVDLSRCMDKDGRLRWQAPRGRWTLLRFGYTPMGTTNKAAPDGGTGLECDKFSRAATDYHFAHMLPYLLPAAPPEGLKGKLGLEIDSYEAGPQTWTHTFADAFRQRRGYAILPYLPALTGRILNDRDHTERFLWDYRRVQAHLVAENYYGRFAGLCHQHGFTAYVQPYDKGPFEEMQIGSKADVCLGECWQGLSAILQGNRPVRRTVKLAASIAHTHNQQRVGAEAFTGEPGSSRWQEYPFALKALGDKMLTQGVNRLVIHRFAHQAHPTAAPGMTMGPWGMHLDRTNTWFEKAGGWFHYLARCQALLQAGHPVADLAYFAGEEANVYTRVERNDLHPAPPEGYDYDLIDAHTLLHQAHIEAGQLVLPGGMRYRALVLQDFNALTPTLLHRLSDLVAAGLVLVGKKPERSLGLHPEEVEHRFHQMAAALWGGIDGATTTQQRYGKGSVHWGAPLTAVLNNLGLPPDFTFTSRSGDAPILYTHRRTSEADIYFVSNQRRSYEEVVGAFRVGSRQPERWDPASGTTTALPLYTVQDRYVHLPLQLEPYGSVFIVFRKPAPGAPFSALEKDGTPLLQATPLSEGPRTLYPDVRDSFTITLWARPEINIMTRPSIHMGDVAHPYTDYYALYPPPGWKLYGGGHATCGLAIGRNGVAVWEHEDYPLLALAAEVPLSGWSHVGLVYEEGLPSLFVNGRLVARGKKSDATIHPGLGEAYLREGASYYNGDRGAPTLWREVLSGQRMSALASDKPPAPPPPPAAQIIHHRGKAALLLLEKGAYRLQKRRGDPRTFTVSDLESPIPLNEDWQVVFPPGLGAPERIHLPRLMSLHHHQEEGVKYFSGTARYQKSFTLTALPPPGRRLLLDLGRVEVIATVQVNGRELGTLWKRPYRVDITDAVQAGPNQLEIALTTLWPNRLIGDEQQPATDSFTTAGASGFEQLVGGGFEGEIGSPIERLPKWYVEGRPKPADGRVAFTTWKHYTKDDPLLEAGLVGPVVVQWAEVHTL